VAVVVGLESYVGAVESQATQFRSMAEQLRARIGDEQRPFLVEYQDIAQHAKMLAEQLEIAQADQKAKAQLLDDYKNQLRIRNAEKDALIKQLGSVTDATKKALANLDAKFDELFQISKQLGEAQDELIRLENKLHEVELARRKKEN
jgi:chromosome segregation ATPase